MSPGKVVIGYDILTELASKFNIDDKIIILSDEIVLGKIDDFIEKVDIKNIYYKIEIFSGECSFEEIDRIAKLANAGRFNCIIGAGGGKIIDTAKAVGKRAELKTITVPTIAATCAAWSSHSAVYTEEGRSLEYYNLEKAPDILWMDKKIIFESPIRYTVSGIVDTLAKWIEASATSQKVDIKSVQLLTALNIAKDSYDFIMENGKKVVADIKDKNYSSEVDKMFDIIIVSAGLVGGIGGAACRAAASHAVNNGFTAIPNKYKNNLHGEVVGFGNIVQLILQKASQEHLAKYINLLISINAPVTIDEMGYSENDLKEIVKKTLHPNESIWEMRMDITPEYLEGIIVEANRLSNKK